MDKAQAEAVVHAILEPDLAAREELQRRRRAQERSASERRVVAWVMLAGVVLGGAIAFLIGRRIALGAVWGGIVASAGGWGWVWARHRAAH